jgi:hypothetical protein
MKISDSLGNVLIDSMPLLTGVDLLGQFKYKRLGSAKIIKATNTTLNDADDTTLGTDFMLVYGDELT